VVSSNSVKSIAAAFLVLLLGAAMPAFSQQELVLIVSTRSEVDNLDPAAVRRLFVGLTVTRNRARLRPVLNESDPQIKALFLRNIVLMSHRTHDLSERRRCNQCGRIRSDGRRIRLGQGRGPGFAGQNTTDHVARLRFPADVCYGTVQTSSGAIAVPCDAAKCTR
jgi:hypothetical protein